jgi:hypothetical protein
VFIPIVVPGRLKKTCVVSLCHRNECCLVQSVLVSQLLCIVVSGSFQKEKCLKRFKYVVMDQIYRYVNGVSNRQLHEVKEQLCRILFVQHFVCAVAQTIRISVFGR